MHDAAAPPAQPAPPHPSPAPRVRHHWMDFIRGLCILLVVALHATPALQFIVGVEPPSWVYAFNGFFAPFRMTTLMFLSGMLLTRSLDKPAGQYIGGKLNQIYWPFLVWSMVVLAAEGRLTLEYILKTPISAPTFLWYLWFICAYYLIALGMKRLGIPALAMAVACLVVSPFLPDFLRMSRFAYLFAFFLLGYHVSANRLDQGGRIPPLLGLAGLALALLGAIMSANGLKVQYNSVSAWIPLSMIVFILWAAPFYRPVALTRPLEWVGRNSIVFYVAHFPAQCVVATALAGGALAAFTLSYGVLIATGILAGVVVTLLRARFEVVAAMFDFSIIQGWFPRRRRRA